MPTDSPAPQDVKFGYLTVLEHAEHGYFGGYLVIDAAGRPLEFHCTAPVRPSRAQEILYGRTLRPHLLGEQIAGGLVRAAKLRPELFVVDQPELVSSEFGDTPAVVLLPAEENPPAARVVPGEETQVGQQRIAFPAGPVVNAPAVISLLELLAERVELAEPLERIHLAIREAQRIGTGDAQHEQRGEAHAA